MATKRKSVSGVKSERPTGQRAISAFFGSQSRKPQEAAKQPAAEDEPPAKRFHENQEGSTALTAAPKKADARTPDPQGPEYPANVATMKKTSKSAKKPPASANKKLAARAEAVPPEGQPHSQVDPSVQQPIKGKAAKRGVAPAKAGSSGQSEDPKPSSQTRPERSEDEKNLVGKRIKVFWPAEKKWFCGRLGAGNSKGRHLVEYDDGDKEWIDLGAEKYEVLPESGKDETKRPAKRARKAQVILSDADEDMDAESPAESEESDWEGGDAASEEEDDDEDDGVVSEEEESPQKKQPAAKAKRKTPAKTMARTEAAKPAKTPVSAPKQAGARKPSAITKGALSSALAPKALAADEHAPANLQNLATGDWQRYAARAAERFPFLHPDKIKDADGRRPGDKGYNPRTLYIPPNWFKVVKVSEGQRQWWEFKAKHFDSVLLFKMGKFYEMFEMDAHTGNEVLGLIYMKGDQPHCGFPEVNYAQHAERLARAGLRVVVIEQTETPDQLRIRNEQRKASGKNKVGVVNREMVAVLTQGTLTEPEMLAAHADAAYVFSLAELPPLASGDGPRLGACAVDAATAQILIGAWTDDEMRSGLRAQLAALRPVEVVLPSSGLSSTTRKVLIGTLRNPRVNELPPGDGFWSAEETLAELDKAAYFGGQKGRDSWPPTLQDLESGGAIKEAALSALGGCISFLRSVLLDKSVLSLERLEPLPQARVGDAGGEVSEEGPEYMALDGSALENLEVLETTSGGSSGTLLGTMDACATPAGRRKLRDWLCRPLARVKDITARQDAVHDLMTVAAETAGRARKAFAGMGDLDRAVARLCVSSLGGMGRDSAAVVLYEDAAKRRVAALLAALRGLQNLQETMHEFEEMELSSSLVRDLVTPGRQFPDLAGPLGHLLDAADWDAAATQGRIIPHKGVDAAYDAAEEAVSAVDGELKEHLKQVREEVHSTAVVYVSLNKDSHVLEVPESKAVPGKYELVSQRKGFKRYMTQALRTLLRRRADVLQDREDAMAGILQGLLKRFAEQQPVWTGAVAAMAQLDALMSLAAAAEQCSAWGPICRPVFLPSDSDRQVLRATELRHPAAGSGTQGSTFVPNDVQLGGEEAPFIVLTGPNMGGKSTLLRQTCLAALMAQVGAWVPARSLELTPVDAIFVRMGARDSIMSGQSTFFVELSETAAALTHATPRSLVALDELGRGTSTSDGAAIASAVLQHLSSTTQCRGLFATHYHKLADAHEGDPAVAIRHMSCHVAPQQDGTEQVTFLYKLAAGACPKSYGTNVARLAGIPGPVVERAAEFAARIESEKGVTEGTKLDVGELDKLKKLVAVMKRETNGTASERVSMLRSVA